MAEIESGAANLARHIGIVNGYGLQAVVGVNKFPTDTDDELELVRRLATEAGAYASEINTAFENGGTGATALAEAVIAAADKTNTFDFAYSLDAPIEEKIRLIATTSTAPMASSSFRLRRRKPPTGPARSSRASHLHGEDAPLALPRPGAEERADRLHGDGSRPPAVHGCRWIVALCGDMMTMPGLGKTLPHSRSTSTSTGRRSVCSEKTAPGSPGR